MITFNLNEYKTTIDTISMNRFKAFEEVAKCKKQAQTFNTPEGCLIGTLGEFAALCYLDQFYSNLVTPELNHFIEHATEYVSDYGDILIVNPDGVNQVEVKAFQKHHPYNQVMPHHLNKYIKNEISMLMFVEVDPLTYVCTITGMVDPEVAKEHGKFLKAQTPNYQNRKSRKDNICCQSCLSEPVDPDQLIEWPSVLH